MDEKLRRQVGAPGLAGEHHREVAGDNRFVAGGRLWERDEVWLTFSAKLALEDGAPLGAWQAGLARRAGGASSSTTLYSSSLLLYYYC